MRNLLALLGAATVTFVALGWYLDWYKLERQPAPAGYQRLQVDINPKKITEDVQTGIERGAEFVSHLHDKSAPDAPPASVPAAGAPNPALPGTAQPAPGNGWHPIATPAPPAPADAHRFNLAPLPPPR